MKTLRQLLASFATLTVAAAPAAASPNEQLPEDAATVVVVTPSPVVVSGASPAAPGAAQPTAATPAPQNESWNNVSHINGQLVPVGERGAYLYKFRKTNIATNPIGWMLGFYGASVSHAIHENVAVRADANIFDFDNQSGYEFGISMPIYLKRAYSGPFIEPGLIVREIRSKTTYDSGCFDCGGNESVAGPEVLFGWHWTFDSGMNVAIAGGAARNLNAKKMSGNEYSSEETVSPAGYFRIGYAF